MQISGGKALIILCLWAQINETYNITRALLGMCVLSVCLTVAAGPVSLLTMWTNRITVANSRKHQEFAGRANSVNNKFELYQQLKDENGCVTVKYQSSVTSWV